MKASTSVRFSAVLHWMAMLAVLTIPQLVLAESWHATVGAQSTNKGRQALAFLPNEIWIHAGDSITWKAETDENHTVTFLKSGQIRPPFRPVFVGCPGFSPNDSTFDGSTCVTTGAIAAGQTFTVIFPTAGNFKLVCIIHANMTAVVHVLDLSEPLPHDQAFYDEQAKQRADALLSDIDHSGDHEREDHEGEHEREDSGGAAVTAGTGEVSATAGGSDTLSVMRFLRPKTVIHAGETVEWTNSDPVTAHTITFGVEPANPVPPSGNVTVDADGARHAMLALPSDSVHSGFIVAAPQERMGLSQAPLGVTRFRVTFSRTGVFPYICALHDGLGMKGEVIVLP
jgi:plastocyanin